MRLVASATHLLQVSLVDGRNSFIHKYFNGLLHFTVQFMLGATHIYKCKGIMYAYEVLWILIGNKAIFRTERDG